MERLQDIVTKKKSEMAGHICRLQTERPAHTAMHWVPEDGRIKRVAEDDMDKWALLSKIWKRRVSADIEPTGSPVTVKDEKMEVQWRRNRSRRSRRCEI